MIFGTCPKCDKAVSAVTATDVDVHPIPSPGHAWKGIKFSCVSCGCVLGVQIDPVALKADMVKEILKALGQG